MQPCDPPAKSTSATAMWPSSDRAIASEVQACQGQKTIRSLQNHVAGGWLDKQPVLKQASATVFSLLRFLKHILQPLEPPPGMPESRADPCHGHTRDSCGCTMDEASDATRMLSGPSRQTLKMGDARSEFVVINYVFTTVRRPLHQTLISNFHAPCAICCMPHMML